MSNHPIETVNSPGSKVKVVAATIFAIAGVVAFYVLAGQSVWVRSGALILGVGCALALLAASDIGRDFLVFARESVRETKKVVWPTRKEAGQITAVVFAFVLMMAIFLWGTDKFLEFILYDVVLGWKK